MIINIKRSKGFQTYELDVPKNITLLELLHKIKEIDPSVGYRHMCRAGICGTCAIKVNSKHILACKTRLSAFEEGVINIEPIDNAHVIKDLVVEHQYFFDKYKSIKPRFWAFNNAKNCIACFVCNGVCPVMNLDKVFAGPFSFARACGILEDQRNQEEDYKRLLEGALNHCTHCKNCNYACPMLVMPEVLIKRLEDTMISKGLLQAPRNDLFFGF